MQNVAIESVMRTQKIPVAFSSSVIHGFVDLFDLATVARSIIMAPARHNLARYELVGQNISYDDVSRIATRVCHKDIQCMVLSPKEFVARMKASGEVSSEYAEEAMESLMHYYDRWRVRIPSY